MTMKTFATVVFTAAYVLIGVRVGYVESEVEARIGRSSSMAPFFFGAAWPAMIAMIGIAVVVFGDNGIYDSAYKYKGSQT